MSKNESYLIVGAGWLGLPLCKKLTQMGANVFATTTTQAKVNDINKMGIMDLDLDLDFKTDNIMRWQGRLVLIDW
jgi:D-arabinose 1-dehydrogenase-like Zn-dependent alcohol dehydrogenase